jgi:hypothetical protein
LPPGRTQASRLVGPESELARTLPVTAKFGPESELALAHNFLEAAGVLGLEGEAGIGRTTAWRSIARQPGSVGSACSCRPTETEAKLAPSTLANTLEPVPCEAVAALPEPQRRALDISLLRVEPGRGLESIPMGINALLVTAMDRRR